MSTSIKVDTPHKSDDQWLEEVRAAHGARAAFYYEMFCELKAEFGEEKALEVLGKTCRSLGLKKAKLYSSKLPDHSAQGFCNYFCSHGSVNNKIFEMESEETSNGKSEGIAYLCRCPLVEGWKAQGVSGDDIEKLCSAAMEFDHGTLEGLSLEGEFETLISKGDSACKLLVKSKESSQV